MTSVKVRTGESIDKAFKIFKRKVDREGILKTIRKRRYYFKPSEKKRNKSKEAVKLKKVKSPRS